MLEYLMVFSCNGIDVIKKLHLCPFEWHKCNFLMKKITSMPFQENTKRTQGDALAFLIQFMGQFPLNLSYQKVRFLPNLSLLLESVSNNSYIL
jgi:hypothetical protein